MPTYGSFDLGGACRVQMLFNPSEYQRNAFWGVTGVQLLWGGNRGRTFVVRGLFSASTRAGVAAKRDTLLSYADGIGRALTDSEGTAWPYVVFTGEFAWTTPYAAFGSSYCREYQATFVGAV